LVDEHGIFVSIKELSNLGDAFGDPLLDHSDWSRHNIYIVRKKRGIEG